MDKAHALAIHTGKVDYNLLEKEKALLIERTIQSRLAKQTLGKIDSLRHTILRSVVAGDYDRAELDLARFTALKGDYPTFKSRTASHFQHTAELINAIRAKRNFPGLASMTVARQQEMLDNVSGHFDELKHTLKHIERVSKDCALEDLRSTAWALRTVCYTVIAVVGVAFVMDFNQSLGQPLAAVYDQMTTSMWQVLEKLI